MALKWTPILLVSLIGISQNAKAQVIYGLDHAKDFKTRSHGPFSVQVGSFHSAQNANQMRNQLASRIKYPVSVRSSGTLHTVVIGPLQSVDAVRAVGQIPTSNMKQSKKTVVSNNVQNPVVKTQEQPVVKSKQTMSPLLKEPLTNNHQNGSWFIAADLGRAYPNVPNFMTVNNGSDYPPPENVDQYSVSLNDMTQLGLQVGYRWNRDEKWVPAYSLALRYQRLFRKNIEGSITQYSLPDFNNYSYSWGISSDVLSAYSKVNIAKTGRVMPYVDAGLGIALNHGMNFSETAYPGITPRVSPGYRAGTTYQFSYNVGLGLDIILTQQLMMYVGYDFQSFGRMQSDNGVATWGAERLSLGTFNTNTGLVGLTYVIGDLS